MDKRTERILRKTEKAGLRKARREGHMLSREELLSVKVQLLPDYTRWLLFGGSVIAGLTSWWCLASDSNVAGSILAVLSVFLLLFSIFGFKRTLETVADQMSYELVDLALDAIGSVIGSALD
jgi:hypothetical protein